MFWAPVLVLPNTPDFYGKTKWPLPMLSLQIALYAPFVGILTVAPREGTSELGTKMLRC